MSYNIACLVGSHSGLVRGLGKLVYRKVSWVQIPLPPPTPCFWENFRVKLPQQSPVVIFLTGRLDELLKYGRFRTYQTKNKYC